MRALCTKTRVTKTTYGLDDKIYFHIHLKKKKAMAWLPTNQIIGQLQRNRSKCRMTFPLSFGVKYINILNVPLKNGKTFHNKDCFLRTK